MSDAVVHKLAVKEVKKAMFIVKYSNVDYNRLDSSQTDLDKMKSIIYANLCKTPDEVFELLRELASTYRTR